MKRRFDSDIVDEAQMTPLLAQRLIALPFLVIGGAGCVSNAAMPALCVVGYRASARAVALP